MSVYIKHVNFLITKFMVFILKKEKYLFHVTLVCKIYLYYKHLFLLNSIHQDSNIQQVLAEGRTFADFYTVCDLLRDLPQKKYSSTETNENVNIDACVTLDKFQSLEISNLDLVDTNSDMLHKQANFNYFAETNSQAVIAEDEKSSINDSGSSVTETSDDSFIFKNESPIKHLPIWLCHSRPRVVEDE